MKKTITVVAASLLAATVLAAPATIATAQPERACLQNNRIWSWRALDDRTLVVTDRNYRPFLVRLGGGCIGLGNNPTMQLQFRTWLNLSCLKRGDEVRVFDRALGRLNCFVQDVQPYGYGPYAGNDRYGRPYSRPY